MFCCVVPFFRVFLGKCGKGRFPVSQNFHPAQCPNPNPCVPKPKPIPMHSPQSDGSRHPEKHSPQSDGSRHCLGGMVIKNREYRSCIRYVFAMFLACAPRNPACVSLFRVCSSFSPHECSKEGKEEVTPNRLPHLQQEGVPSCMFALQGCVPYGLRSSRSVPQCTRIRGHRFWYSAQTCTLRRKMRE